MKKKLSQFVRRLPIDFGDEPVCLIPVSKRTRSARRGRRASGLLDATRNTDNSDSATRTRPSVRGSTSRNRAFTLIEILVVLALLSLIVFALMAVFGATQRAFRASLTQSDTLEGGRSAMDLIAGDLEAMIPSGGPNYTGLNGNEFVTTNSPINFCSNVRFFQPPSFPPFPPSPLYQSLVGSPSGALRTNILEDIFILSKGNVNGVSSWIGTGYSVNTNLADGTLYPLYRFYMTTNAASGAMGQFALYTNFIMFAYSNSATWSHLMDGVINLTTRPYDTNGIWMTNGYYAYTRGFPSIPVQNATFIGSGLGETSCFFVSNAVPVSVGIVLATLEDRVLQHAEGLNGLNQSNYLANSAGQVHVFSRRVWIRNFDPAAYQ
ncbi:MAG TPA: type II secretion system protein [Pseudomonadales bacterium]|nr:type II secretion system protein [Pseudomonadales bacterium]